MTSPVTICFSTHIHFSHTARLNDWLIFFGYYLACCFLHLCISNLIKQRSDKREQTTDIDENSSEFGVQSWEKEKYRVEKREQTNRLRNSDCRMWNGKAEDRQKRTDYRHRGMKQELVTRGSSLVPLEKDR